MIIACPDCAAVQSLPARLRRGHLDCWQCGGVLEHRTGRSVDGALACAIATWLLLLPANLLPLVLVRPMSGVSAYTFLGSGCVLIWQQGWPLIAVVLGLQAILLPFFRFGLLVAVLGAVRLRRNLPWVGRAFRYAEALDLWAMPDVLLAGGMLGYGRVAVVMPAQIQPGGWCLVAAALLSMLTRATLDRRTVWQRIGTPAGFVSKGMTSCIACDLVVPDTSRSCPRCGACLHRRKPFAVMRTNALLLTALVLLPVANYFPASSLWEAGIAYPHTVLGNVLSLFQDGYAPVAMLLFCTSIVIPVFKIGGIAWLSYSVISRSGRALRGKSRLYRNLEAIGRWSNLDPFSVMIFAPMLQFGPLARITLGGGGSAFVAVIVLSTVAAKVFDPRLMWDAADPSGQADTRA
ncbi:MAG TPA: paraquat-inducible protein A [Rhodopila sp.]|nr:paraquat-inducible protein A [Rhodopila sp.]